VRKNDYQRKAMNFYGNQYYVPINYLIFIIVIFSVINHFPKEVLAGETGTVQKPDNVIVVTNPKRPKPKDGLEVRIAFKEELSIGAAGEGDENYMFGNRVYFNTDDKGNFYVNDWDRKRIQKYDAQGKYILTMGRPGQGPGEFKNVWKPEFDKDNNLYVTDIGNDRVSFFDINGKFLKQIKIPPGFSPQFINSRGFFVGYQSTFIEDPHGDKSISVLGLFDDKSKLISEIHKSTQEFKPSSGRGAESRARFLANLFSNDAFKPSTSFVLAENESIYFGYPEKYEICVYSPEGKLIKIFKREYDPVKVSKKHIENFIEFLENEFFRFMPDPEDIKKKVYQLIEYPKYIPAYQRFTLMENGWLAVIVDSIENEYTLFDIFDEEGNYIAQFKATIPAEGLFFKNGKAYALAIENDYRFVKRYNFEIQEYREKRWVGVK